MRSCLAAVIAASVCSLQAHALAFHVHAAAGHDRGDPHAHAPAIHHHDDFDSALHLEAEDVSVGGTVITMTVPAATMPAPVAVDAEVPEALAAPELQPAGDARAIEVRSHGPPPRAQTLLRGPPSSAFL